MTSKELIAGIMKERNKLKDYRDEGLYLLLSPEALKILREAKVVHDWAEHHPAATWLHCTICGCELISALQPRDGYFEVITLDEARRRTDEAWRRVHDLRK